MTRKGVETKEEKEYFTILGSTGDIRLKVDEGTEGAVVREYETSKGEKGVKHELVFKSISGQITDLKFIEGDFGTNLLVTLTYSDDADTTNNILSLNVATPFGEDFMKKLPAINLEEWVTITPYKFTDEKGRERKGLTVTQGDTKIDNFFYDKVAGKNLHGFPEPKGDTKKYNSDKWKAYFLEARIFLIDYIKENFTEKAKELE